MTPQSGIQRHHLVAAMGTSVALLGIGLAEIGDPRLWVVGGSASVCIAALSGLALYVQRSGTRIRDLWLTVPGLFWGVAAVALGLAALAWVGPEAPSLRTSTEWVAVALRLASVWIWGTVLGYAWVEPRASFGSPLDRFAGLNERFRGSGSVGFVVGLVSIAYLLTVGRFSFVSGVEAAFSATSSVPQIAISTAYGTTLGAVVVLWKGLGTGSRRLTAIGLAMFGATVAVQLYGGMKEPVLVTMFGLVATYRLARGRLPRWLFAVGVLVALAVFSFVNPYRENVRYGDLSPWSAASQVTAELTSAGAASVASETIGSIFDRVRDIDAISVIVERTPDSIRFADPITLPSEIAAVLVPRSIWPSKPIVSDGRQFAIEYYGYPPDTDVAVAVTTAGDSYRYGGWLATGLIGLLLGAYLAVLDRAVRPLSNPAALLMFIPLAISLAQSGNGVVVTAASQLQTFIVTFAMMWLTIAKPITGSRPR